MSKYAKALGALLGMATPAGVISAAAFIGLEISTELAVTIVGVLGVIGTYFAPANTSDAVDETAQAPYEAEPCGECPANGCDACPLS